jgi:predicted nucleic-acid-binding Zn-ribbon protein
VITERQHQIRYDAVMKTGACPKCACTKLYVVDEVRQPNLEYANTIHPLYVSTFAIPASEVGVTTGNTHRTMVGTFEAWICSSCGLTEWYAKDVGEAFERLLALGRKVHVRVVERQGGTPFR